MTASQRAEDVRRWAKRLALKGGAIVARRLLNRKSVRRDLSPGTGRYWASINSRRQGSANLSVTPSQRRRYHSNSWKVGWKRYGAVSWMRGFGDAVRARTGPGSRSGSVREQRSRLLAEGPGIFLRPLLRARADVSGLRGTPLPPSNHARGVHPRTSERLSACDGHDLSRSRGGAIRRRIAGLSIPETHTARHRNRRVHGR